MDQNGHQATSVAVKERPKKKPKPEIDVRSAAVAAAAKKVAAKKAAWQEAEAEFAGEQRALAECVKQVTS